MFFVNVSLSPCVQYNGLDIGDGHVLAVSRADFGKSQVAAVTPDIGAVVCREDFPAACKANEFPIAVLNNVLDPLIQYTHSEIEDIESDLFLEIKKNGFKVKHVLGLSHRGCVVVTFAETVGAEACCASLNGRRFDSKTIQVSVMSPSQHVGSSAGQTGIENISSFVDSLLNGINANNNSSFSSSNTISVTVEDTTSNESVQDVEDFLNSLL
jgi:hypothetical protein